MYSAASPRFTIHSAIAGGWIPKAMFCAYVAQVAWLSPQIPQMRLVMKCASRGSLPFMKMLYPRKMDEVLWHSATWRFSKSILVKIPKLPTIRVIGSQFISTNFLEPVGVPFAGEVIVPIVLAPLSLVSFYRQIAATECGPDLGAIARSQFGARMPPFRFFVHCGIGEGAQRSNGLAVNADARGGDLCSRRFIHK